MAKRRRINKTALKLLEAKSYLALAKIYLDIAIGIPVKGQKRRGVVDEAYNAAELGAKGLLVLKLDFLPGTHGGVVNKLGEIYVKTGILNKETGRNLRRGLNFRNQARYERKAKITDKMCSEVLNLAKQLIKFLEKETKG